MDKAILNQIENYYRCILNDQVLDKVYYIMQLLLLLVVIVLFACGFYSTVVADASVTGTALIMSAGAYMLGVDFVLKKHLETQARFHTTSEAAYRLKLFEIACGHPGAIEVTAALLRTSGPVRGEASVARGIDRLPTWLRKWLQRPHDAAVAEYLTNYREAHNESLQQQSQGDQQVPQA